MSLRVLDAAGIEEADVVGYSHGGAVVQQLAIGHPDRVNRLVLFVTACGIGAFLGYPCDVTQVVLTPNRESRWRPDPLGFALAIRFHFDVIQHPPVAYVEAYPGATLDLDILAARCHRDLAKVKVPETITLIDELPKNPVGKPDQPALRREDAGTVSATAPT